MEGSTAFQKELILPKGIVEVIFNLDAETVIIGTLKDNSFHLPRCFINGFNTTPIALTLPHRQSFLGIRLQPLAVKALIGAPGSCFLDALTDLSLVNKLFDSLWHQLAEVPGFGERVQLLLRWIESCKVRLQPRDILINDFLSSATQDALSLSQLADKLCYSGRQLTRRITEGTGLNAEAMMLYKKYLHALRLMHHTDMPLTQIAYACHFSDQSHFTKTFKAFTGRTPKQYNRQGLGPAGHIYEDVR